VFFFPFLTKYKINKKNNFTKLKEFIEKMSWDCIRRPINCYNDKTRYYTMVVLYIIDLIFFIVRLSLVSNDISKRILDTMGFLVPILLFDLIASVPIIICNIIYISMRCCFQSIVHNNPSFDCLWHFSTMTCIRLDCHKDRPQAILLMRVMLIICSLILKFMCFVLGAACSARFKSECTAYTIVAAIALVPSVLIIMVEFINYFRLWKYNPTDTRNGNNNQISPATADTFFNKMHRRNLGFIHHSLLNDENAQSFRHSRCEQGPECKSESLHHYLFYHSLETEDHINISTLTDQEKKSFIAFYQTTKQEALEIAQNGFPYGDDSSGHKDYLHLKPNIFFTRSCTKNSTAEAIICVRLNLGRTLSLTNEDNLNRSHYFGFNDGLQDTLYIESTRRFYLRMPAQIEKWIIIINNNVPVNDTLDGKLYQPCI
jgi:hypothetical protein